MIARILILGISLEGFLTCEFKYDKFEMIGVNKIKSNGTAEITGRIFIGRNNTEKSMEAVIGAINNPENTNIANKAIKIPVNIIKIPIAIF